MSHFSELKTRLHEKELIKKALKAMKFELVEEEAGVEVRGFFDESERAEFKILTESKYDIGFRRSADGNYEVVGDWDLLPKVSRIEKDLFVNALKKNYAQAAVEKIAEEQGYEIEVQENDGEIEMVVTQW